MIFVFDNLRSIHPAAKAFISFFLMTEFCFIAYMYHIFVHSSAGGHSGCFHVLAIVNSAVMNTGMHVSQHVFIQIYAWRGIVGSFGSSIFSFLRTSILFAIVAVSVYIPINGARGSLFPHSVSSIDCL